MFLKKIRLLCFRNHPDFEADFQKTNIIFGPNASGKTNLLEAIYFLAFGRSFKTSLNQEVISFGKQFAKIKGEIKKGEEEFELDLLFLANQKVKKSLLINKKPKPLMELFGLFFVVLFRPESLSLVTGPPSLRRQALNLLLLTLSKRYAQNLVHFSQVLKQRNRLLFQIKEGKRDPANLEIWDHDFVQSSLFLQNMRQKLVDQLNQFLPSQLRLVYHPSPEKDFVQELQRLRSKECQLGFSLIGPQKDDFVFEYQKKELASFGSRGEIRQAIIFFCLAQWELYRKRTGFEPVLLLDDVFAELDKKRRGLIKEMLKRGQVILTTTSLAYLDAQTIKQSKVIELK